MKKIAIIGTGGISHVHITSYLEQGGRAKIVALVDILPHKALAVKQKYGLAANVYESHEQMLACEGGIDVVNICTPPYTHCEIAVDCLAKGINVLVEKPMAVSVEECDQMIAAGNAAGRLLGVVAQNRFTDDFNQLVNIMESGLIGVNRFTQITSAWFRGLSYYDLWWRGTWAKEGGGATLSQGIHHVDALLALKGSPVEVSTFLANVSHDNSEVEDLSLSSLRYADGTLSQLTASTIHHGEEQVITIMAEHASIAKPYKIRATKTAVNGFPEAENAELIAKVEAFRQQIPPLKYTGHAGQIVNYLDAVDGVARLQIDGADGMRAMELIIAMYKSHQEKIIVELPLAKTDVYYTHQGLLAKMEAFFEKTSSVEEFAGDIVVGSSEKGALK
ncbi:MAG: Gfo/Idh/MocA family protein [Culicoidibacterales bacterium]